MSERERIVEKIRKLLALAERGGTRAEGEAAALKAAELMQRHAVDEDELTEALEISAVEIFGVDCGIADEVLALLCSVAPYYECSALLKRVSANERRHGMDVFGTPEARAIATTVIRSIEAAIRRELGAFPHHSETERRSFSLGFILGLLNRLEEQRQHIERNNPLPARALVRVTPAQRAEAAAVGDESFLGTEVVESQDVDRLLLSWGSFRSGTFNLNNAVGSEKRP